ncbi:hypothetical protein [Methylotenera sp. 1P/1]|uniref:hypothetical protein n=1 Tax=Methylotenera sp. 1P/1 TaxID=1131551 RepID=UPI0003643F37|nr:hypothetical protein [Methylotenera sp. 1P/1]
MSHTINVEALHSFTLSHEQIIHIAASLASDIGSASDFMPDDFLLRHHALLEMFMSLLTTEEKIRVIKPVPYQGALQ